VVSDAEAAEIERLAVIEGEEVEADSASAMPRNLTPPGEDRRG
jgi:hypothetical protein